MFDEPIKEYVSINLASTRTEDLTYHAYRNHS